MALTTRPSQPCDGRTAPGAADTTARQPRRTPSSGANGISSALRAGKADHLAGDRRGRAPVSIDDARADRHRVERTRDLDHQAAHADDAAVDLDAVQFGDLFGQSLHADERSAGNAIRPRS